MDKYLKKDGEFDHHKWSRLNTTTLTEASQDVQSKMVKAIPMGYDYKKLAQDVAGIIHDEYGTHSVKPFLTALTKALNNYNM
jgi:hypothetical protein